MLRATLFGMKVDIKIQSISDIITNSSSEIFCRIQSDKLNEIFEILKPLFPNTDSEMGPYIYLEKDEEDYEEDYEDYYENSTPCITISFPSCFTGYEEFYAEGLINILNKYFGNENYSIKYGY